VKKLIKTLVSNNSKRFLLLSFLLLLFGGTFCTNSLDNGGTQSSTGAGQIVINLKPNSLFGNGNELSQVQVVTGQIPDGSTVEFKLTGSNLPDILEGCLLDKGTTVVNGQVSANLLAGIVIASGSGTPAPATVNVAVTITGPDGKPETRFSTVILNPVSIVPPASQTVTVNPDGSSTSAFVSLTFETIGILPGTTVNFLVNPSGPGSVSPTSATVSGSEGSGIVTTQFNTVNGMGGTQTVTAQVILPNPHDINPSCPDVPEVDRTVEASVVITQSLPTPTPASSPVAMNVPSGGSNSFTIAEALMSFLIPVIPVFAIALRIQQRKRNEKN
jgi:hypothetical protein